MVDAQFSRSPYQEQMRTIIAPCLVIGYRDLKNLLCFVSFLVFRKVLAGELR
jgi:hypothetical protein